MRVRFETGFDFINEKSQQTNIIGKIGNFPIIRATMGAIFFKNNYVCVAITTVVIIMAHSTGLYFRAYKASRQKTHNSVCNKNAVFTAAALLQAWARSGQQRGRTFQKEDEEKRLNRCTYCCTLTYKMHTCNDAKVEIIFRKQRRKACSILQNEIIRE